MVESTAPGRPPSRRGLGPGLTVFLVVDALLVLAVLVALAAFLSGGGDAGEPEAQPGVSPSASPQPQATPEPEPTPTQPPSAGAFALPSANIACEITADAATCTIADSAAEPVVVEGCAGTAGQVLTVTAEGVSTPCVQGALPGPAAPGTPVLDYGESTTAGDFTCESARTGVTCRHDPTGAGFLLARAGHQVIEPTA